MKNELCFYIDNEFKLLSKIINNNSNLYSISEKSYNDIHESLSRIKKIISDKYKTNFFDVDINYGKEIVFDFHYLDNLITIDLKNKTISLLSKNKKNYNKKIKKDFSVESIFSYKKDDFSVKKLITLINNELSDIDGKIISSFENIFNEISNLKDNWNFGSESFEDVVNKIEIIKNDVLDLFRNKKIDKIIYVFPTVDKKIVIEFKDSEDEIILDLSNDAIIYTSYDDDFCEKYYELKKYSKEKLEFFINKN